MRLLHLIPALDHDGPARDLLHLVRSLPHGEFTTTVACLGGDVQPLDGVDCLSLGDGRRFDPRPLLELRRLCRQVQPDVIHVWQPAALRALRLAGVTTAPVVCSAAVAPLPSTFDRWLLRGIDRVVVHTQREAERCRRLGLADEQIAVLPVPVVAAEPAPRRARPTIACLGRLERSAGFFDAPWAFDILQFIHPETDLLIVGDGPDRVRLEQFTARAQSAPHVYFRNACADGPALIAAADVVWALDPYESGLAAGMTALAAARPVVTAAGSALAELIVPDVSALTYRPGEPAELGRQTRLLLDDAVLTARVSAAGLAVAQQFPGAELVRQAALLYQGLRDAGRRRQSSRVGA